MKKKYFYTYGLTLPILAKYLISHIEINTWFDLGTGNGEILRRIGIIPQNGYAVDINLPENIPGFKMYKCTIEEFLSKDVFLKQHKNQRTLITLFDVIEHYEKEIGFNLLKIIEKHSDFSIIFTPEGFLKQDATTHNEYINNPYMWHRSGWFIQDFINNGYCVVILKNYHIKPIGHQKNFNALLAFKSNINSFPTEKILTDLMKYYIYWLFNPFNMYLMFRNFLRNR